MRRIFIPIFLTVCFSLFAFPVFAQEEVSPTGVPVEGEEIASEEVAEEGEIVPAENETPPPQEKYLVFRASSEKIRMLETDTDIFSASQLHEKKRVLTSIANGELQRRFYDEHFRVEKIEYWNIASSSAQSKIVRVLNYAFFDDGKIQEIKENDFGAQTQTRTLFNDLGKIRLRRKNQFKDGALESFEIFSFTYDEKARILQEKRQLFNVANKKERLALTELNENIYDDENLLQNSFYENSVLRLRKVYSNGDLGTFIQTTYFDGGFTVREFYENGTRVSSSISNPKSGGAK